MGSMVQQTSEDKKKENIIMYIMAKRAVKLATRTAEMKTIDDDLRAPQMNGL